MRPYRRSALAAASDLLEREGELALFGAHLRAAAKGAGGLVAIEGRAGMGKTRLVAEARASAEAAGFEVLAARGGELEEEFAYGVVRQLFEPLLATASDDLRAELLSGAAGLAAPLFDESQLALALEGPTDTSFATLHGLYWIAANLALRRPTLLAIDDLHWVDAPSLRWVIYLARRLEGLPLLVVGALRPPGQSQHPELLTELMADPATAVVRPAALGIESVAALARKTLAAEPDERFCAACREATGGNPLFIRALLDTLAAEGVAPTAEASARVHEVGPEPVARAVMLRLSRLPPEATTLARAVAMSLRQWLTRSRPIPSWRPAAIATLTLVPTESVLAASRPPDGSAYRPAKGPTPATTSGPCVASIAAFIPASIRS